MSNVDPIAVGAKRARPLALARWTYLGSKGLVDALGAAVLLLLLSPLLLVIAAAILVTSRGPAIYRQRRVGLRGRHFRMWKFRTMIPGAETATGPVWARADDPRVTPLGRLLRRTHLDELPQLVNVLRGEMSLVGPRPERPIFAKVFAESIDGYRRRHSVRPGITGLAQISLEYDECVEDVRRKLALDLLYIRRMCWRLDAKVLVRTVGRVFAGGGR